MFVFLCYRYLIWRKCLIMKMTIDKSWWVKLAYYSLRFMFITFILLFRITNCIFAVMLIVLNYLTREDLTDHSQKVIELIFELYLFSRLLLTSFSKSMTSWWFTPDGLSWRNSCTITVHHLFTVYKQEVTKISANGENNGKSITKQEKKPWRFIKLWTVVGVSLE